jgi:hypothetical protein
VSVKLKLQAGGALNRNKGAISHWGQEEGLSRKGIKQESDTREIEKGYRSTQSTEPCYAVAIGIEPARQKAHG